MLYSIIYNYNCFINFAECHIIDTANKLRPYINKNTAIFLTHSLILSRLNYCNTLLTGQTKTSLKTLDAIINRSIRLIYKLKKYDYSTSIPDLRLRLNWMTTANSIDYKILTILKKTLTYDQPHNLIQVLNMKTNCRKLRPSHLITLLPCHCIRLEIKVFVTWL